MATSKTFNGSTYSIPANREPRGWGTSLSAFLIDVADNALSKAGGNFTLTADVNFGTAYGIVSKYIKYSSGTLMLNTSGVITVPNATDTLVGKATTDTLTNKTLTSPVINTPTGIVKGDVGLGNVDNTSDANKPISTATQTALDLKANLASPTIVSPTIDNGMTMNHESTPATPSAGTVKVYPKSDNSLYVLDPNGVETQVGSGSGQGEKNYITNPSMKSATTGWSNVGDLDVARTTTASELPREYSTAAGIKITADSNTQSVADYVYYDFTLDDVDLSKKLKIQWSQKLFGAYTDGQLAVVITTQADRTTALHTPVTTAIPAVSNDFTTSFDAGTTATLSLVIRATGDMTTDTGIVISDVVVGPGIITQGAAVSEWQSYTPTLSASWGTTSNVNFRYRRVGDSAEVEGSFTAGTTTAGEGQIGLPSGLTVGTLSKSGALFGQMATEVASDPTRIIIGTAGDAYVKFTSISTASDIFTGMAPNNIGSTFDTSMHFVVPIASWAGSGTVNLGAGAQVEYAYPTGTWDASSSTAGTDVSYGPVGTVMATLTTVRTKYVLWQKPPQDGDLIFAQIKELSGGWSDSLYPYVDSGTAANIAGIRFVGNSATGISRFDIGRYATLTTAWTASNSVRFVKVNPSSPVGFGLAGTDGSSGLVNPYTEGSGVVYGATFTCTPTNSTNIASSSAGTGFYTRIGKIVQISGYVSCATTAAANTLSLIEISLPIASNFTASTDLWGVATREAVSGTAQGSGGCYASAANDRMTIQFNSTVTTSNTLTFNAQYIIK